MYFENKKNRQTAIEAIKKINSTYGISYHYDLKKDPIMGRYLMNKDEYYKIIKESAKNAI